MDVHDKQLRLERIAADIIEDNICPDLAQTATQLVMGDGSVDAHIVFIGEAPGKQEDLQGIPFVGASGIFLNEMLAGIGFVRSDVYITNIVKYRPPQNRDPRPAEKRAFAPYLGRQLDVIQPQVVVTLGRHSMEFFLPAEKISEAHGQPRRHTLSFPGGAIEIVLLPLYHPAAALYNGALRKTLIDDFAVIPSLLT